MPIYEFYCEKHGRFEKRTKTGTKRGSCPSCKKRCSKVISKVSFAIGNKSYNVPKTVDLAVGKASEKAWKVHNERKAKRKKETRKKT